MTFTVFLHAYSIQILLYSPFSKNRRKLMKEFKQLWSEGSQDRQRIMKLVLDRVWVSGENMIALLIRP